MHWLSKLWKQLLCKHTKVHHTETEHYHVVTCLACDHQHIEKKIT